MPAQPFSRQSRKSLRTRGSSSAASGMLPNSASAAVSMRRYSACVLAASFSSNSTELPKRERRPRNDLAEWDEQLYLAVNADVSAAVAHGIFKSGREHYELAGRVERREGASVPSTWDEQGYLQANPEVVSAVSRGTFLNGYHHYLAAGRVQGRIGGLQPADWDEAGYLAAHPDARIRVALGLYRTGLHPLRGPRPQARLCGRVASFRQRVGSVEARLSGLRRDRLRPE